MSTTYSIGCCNCCRKLWIGQTSCDGPLRIYGPDTDTPLAAFLDEHQFPNHLLMFAADSYFEGEEWKEHGEP